MTFVQKLGVLVSVLVISCQVFQHATFAEPLESEPPAEFCLQRNPIPEAAPPGLRMAYFLDNVIEENGELHTRGGFLEFAGPDGYAHKMNLPDLHKSDVLCLRDAAYRVNRLDKNSKTVCFERLRDTGAPGRAEAVEAKMNVGDYAFYIEPGGGGSLHGVSFQALYERAENEKAQVKVSFRPHFRPQGKSRVLVPPSTHLLGLHDVLRIGDVDYEVVSIVPPDEKLQRIGWFEISKKVKDDSNKSDKR